MQQEISIESIRAIARKFHLVVKECGKHYKVFRIVNGRPIYQGKRWVNELPALNSFINRLIETVDYQNSKCVD